MARLAVKQMLKKQSQIFACIKYTGGCKESEIAEMTGFDRRDVNNYLRSLRDDGLIKKTGWIWKVR